MSGQFDPRITAYFGDAVMQAGFMPLPHLFLRHYRRLGLSQVQAMFVLQLMEIAWDVGDPPTSVSKLAERMGVSPRTIRQCSQDVHALRLVEIFDQFDASGAQVENGYDLSPLFGRLAEFAPVQPPVGTLRVRRTRDTGAMMNDAAHSVALQDSAPAPLHHSAAPHGDVPPSPAAAHCRPPEHDPAGLKAETKNHRKTQTRNTQEHGAGVGGVSEVDITKGVHAPIPDAGRSLRWNVPLTGDEIGHSHAVLERAGLNRSVAAAAALTLHPAETWALWCYARGAGLGPAWIASQCYDFTARQPRMADLSRRYDAAGRALAALEPEDAEAVLDAVDACCPDQLERLHLEPSLESRWPVIHGAVEAVWAVVAEQRGSRVRVAAQYHALAEAPFPTPPSLSTLHADQDALWQAARSRAAQEIAPADFDTWIAPLALLDIIGDAAILGAPNVFVRDIVARDFVPLIAGALQAAYGRRIRVELAIVS